MKEKLRWMAKGVSCKCWIRREAVESEDMLPQVRRFLGNLGVSGSESVTSDRAWEIVVAAYAEHGIDKISDAWMGAYGDRESRVLAAIRVSQAVI